MIRLAFAVLAGVACGLTVWLLRGPLRARWNKDVEWLQLAVWRFSPEPFDARPWVAGYYATALLLLVVCWLTPLRYVDLLISAAILAAPRIVLENRWMHRRREIGEQLPAAVRLMSSGVASGLTLAQAIERLAERGPSPIKMEFRLMANLWKHGSDLPGVIREARRRIGLPDFDLFASAVLVNQRMGGDITRTLDRLADALESTDRMRRDVFAATSEGRTNVKVLVIAPFIMLGFVELMDHEAVALLFSKGLGLALLGIAGLLTAIGTIWAWSIVHADV